MKLENDGKPLWEIDGDGDFLKVGRGTTSIPPGVYNAHLNGSGRIYFEATKQFSDKVYKLPGLPIDFLIDQVDKFWESKADYDRYHFTHKRGILLYGPPGNGKTSVISALIDSLVSKGGLVLNVRSFDRAVSALKILKDIEPDRKIMTLMEDMDTLLDGDLKTQEPYALSMLDGQDQVQGIIHVGTTNYPDKLADRYIKRPGRFDLVVGMGMPIKDTRRAYFQIILEDENHPALEYLTDNTEGLSLAYLREIASSYLCLGVPVEESVQRLTRNFKTTSKDFAAASRSKAAAVGFSIGYDGSEGSKDSEQNNVIPDAVEQPTKSSYYKTIDKDGNEHWHTADKS